MAPASTIGSPSLPLSACLPPRTRRSSFLSLSRGDCNFRPLVGAPRPISGSSRLPTCKNCRVREGCYAVLYEEEDVGEEDGEGDWGDSTVTVFGEDDPQTGSSEGSIGEEVIEDEDNQIPLFEDDENPTPEENSGLSASTDREDIVEEAKEKGEEYSITMQAAMGNSALVYRHELGMNYARVLPDLIVGSCLQTPADVDWLRDREGVGAVLCLQQDSDMEYFGLDLQPILERVAERGDVLHVRAEIRDFDPFSLRMELPLAVAKLHRAARDTGTAYVHCTAGLGRAPAVALAYMWWLRGFTRLEDANEVLQGVRRCGPKLFAIRAALCDLLTGNPRERLTVTWRTRGVTPSSVEVAGLDVGWHNKLALERGLQGRWWTTTRELPAGTYYYKFIINGDRWSFSPDAPITHPDRDNNVNNYAELPGASLDARARELRRRLMEEGAPLGDEERRMVVEKINAIADTL